MKHKRGFPNRADLHYWQLRQPLPNWAKDIGLAISKCSIDEVVNSHAPKDKKEARNSVSNVLYTLAIIRRSEGNYNPKGEMMRQIRAYARRPYSARTSGGYSMEGFYGIFARRILKKIDRRKTLTHNSVIANAIAYS